MSTTALCNSTTDKATYQAPPTMLTLVKMSIKPSRSMVALQRQQARCITVSSCIYIDQACCRTSPMEAWAVQDHSQSICLSCMHLPSGSPHTSPYLWPAIFSAEQRMCSPHIHAVLDHSHPPDLLTAWCDGEWHLGLDAGCQRLARHRGRALHVLIRGVGAGANQARLQLRRPAVLSQGICRSNRKMGWERVEVCTMAAAQRAP